MKITLYNKVRPKGMLRLLSFYLFTFLLLATSCDDYLDKNPDNRADLTTADDISELLVSAYPTTHYAAIAELMSDNTDEVVGSSYTAYNLFQEEAATWKDGTTEITDSPFLLWDACYHAIACANEALEAIEKQGNPESLAQQRGEALVCRAYNHWVLTNIFTKGYSPRTSTTDLGVPYMKTVENTVKPHYDRGTVAEDYAQMAADLNEGIPLLKDATYSVPAYHFTYKAAEAFAARFWLFYVQPDGSNYDRVISYAHDVLTDDPTSMLKNWKEIGTLSPSDNIRANAFIDADQPSNLLLYTTSSLWARMYGPYRIGEKYCHDEIISTTETNQARDTSLPSDYPPHYYSLWGSPTHLNYKIFLASETPKVFMDKFGEYFEYTDRVNGVGYPRELFPALLADEVMLNMVEAYVMKKDYTDAISNINIWLHNFTDMTKTVTLQDIIDTYGDVRPPVTLDDAQHTVVYYGMNYYRPLSPTPKKRLNPDFDIEAGNQELFLQCLLHCRRIMTLHEGLRWFDIKRYGIEIYRRRLQINGQRVYVTVTDTLGVDDPRRAVQLPQSVINAGMEANPR